MISGGTFVHVQDTELPVGIKDGKIVED